MNIRTFAAIELSGSIKERIETHIKKLRSAVPEANPSWTRVDNIHLTLKFFGDVEETRIERIARAVSKAVDTFAPFDISIGDTGAFPKPSQPRVLWIGIEDTTGQLSRLHNRFEEECALEGFDKESRAFRPHLTIARIRKPEGARRLAEVNKELNFPSMKLRVSELVVFRSELSSKGSKYTPLSRHSLSDML